MGNLVFAIIIMLFSILLLFPSLSLPFMSTTGIGPGGWPTSILILLFLLGLILLLRSIREIKSVKEVEERPRGEVKRLNNHWKLVIIISLFLISISLMGFIIALPLFFLASVWLLGIKRKLSLVLNAIVSSFVFIYIFTLVLGVPLPRGVGFFRDFSLLFY